MSCGRKKTQEELEADKQSKKIDETIKKDKKQGREKYKLLLLGTGDAGKSTFLKQMQIIHKGGFEDTEIQRFIPILRHNCLSAMQTIVEAAKQVEIKFSSEQKAAVQEISQATTLTDKVADKISLLASSEQVTKVLEKQTKLNLPGGANASYYLKNAKRFAAGDYMPDQNDIIKAKNRTTGILEVQFSVDTADFSMVDVGGQRSERRKWIHCFADATAVLFLVALDEFDMVLEEDDQTNRMEESLNLFQKLTGSQWLRDVSFILFLNKSDLFEEKIKHVPLASFFEDYATFTDTIKDKDKKKEKELGFEYIRKQFKDVFEGSKELYAFMTCAIDTDSCKKVFLAVRDQVIRSGIADSGL